MYFTANVPTLTKLEEKVHKSDTPGLDSATVQLYLDIISKHAFKSVSAKSLRSIRLFDCTILDLSQTHASKFLGCLVPQEKLDEKIVRTFVLWILSNSRRLNLEHCLKPALRWINCVLKHDICSVDKLQIAYEPFIQILGIGTVVRDYKFIPSAAQNKTKSIYLCSYSCAKYNIYSRA